jgi:Fe(3+) dicitrate transport protein
LGFNYILITVTHFAGVHRGFAPPRIKDAITNGGEALHLDAELSWNYELGIRANVTSYLYFELTGFVLDFSNQIIPVSESSGGSGTGLVNGGETLHRGIESGVRIDFHPLTNSNYQISLSANATFSQATYSNDRFISVNDESINIKDNRLPMHRINISEISFTSPSGFKPVCGKLRR